ncbi:uncharacterized protein METZ01_LOCUS497519, partial [marine metagenome]
MLRIFSLIWILMIMVGCAEVETETQGTAFVSMRLE